MKIKLNHHAGYIGLRNISYPVEVEVSRMGFDDMAYVRMSTLMGILGYAWNEWDATEGGEYVFLKEEYEVVEEKKSLSDLFGENLTDTAKGDLEKAGELAAKDLGEKVFGADRKDKLISLVKDYGGAINDGCYESERGSAESLKACIAEEKRLLAEIIKMINEGV